MTPAEADRKLAVLEDWVRRGEPQDELESKRRILIELAARGYDVPQPVLTALY